jgi:hypothetical protein
MPRVRCSLLVSVRYCRYKYSCSSPHPATLSKTTSRRNQQHGA